MKRGHLSYRRRHLTDHPPIPYCLCSFWMPHFQTIKIKLFKLSLLILNQLFWSVLKNNVAIQNFREFCFEHNFEAHVNCTFDITNTELYQFFLASWKRFFWSYDIFVYYHKIKWGHKYKYPTLVRPSELPSQPFQPMQHNTALVN